MRHRLIGLVNVTTRFVSGAAIPNPVNSISTQPSSKKTRLYWAIAGFGVGTAIGGGLGYKEYVRRTTAEPLMNTTSDQPTYILQAAPDFPPSRTIIFPTDTSGLKLTLYQYQTCPFCCKVRAMLDFCGISYNIVEVNPVLRTQLKWSEKYRKVPILIVETPEGQVLQLNDSSMIISALYSYMLAQKNGIKNSNTKQEQSKSKNELVRVVESYPTIKFTDDNGIAQTDVMNKYFIMGDLEEGDVGLDSRTKEKILDERKWRKWADSVYVHTLSPNIYRTFPEAIESFKNFDRVGEWDKNFKNWERTLVIYVGAFAMWLIGKKLQKRHNLKSDVRLSLYEESDYWFRTIKKRNNGDFMGGSTPNLSDLAVYGVLSSIEGCAAFNDLDENSKIIKQWYRKVQQHLKNQTN